MPSTAKEEIARFGGTGDSATPEVFDLVVRVRPISVSAEVGRKYTL